MTSMAQNDVVSEKQTRARRAAMFEMVCITTAKTVSTNLLTSQFCRARNEGSQQLIELAANCFEFEIDAKQQIHVVKHLVNHYLHNHR